MKPLFGKWIDMVTGECREQGKVEREWDLGPRGLDAMLIICSEGSLPLQDFSEFLSQF